MTAGEIGADYVAFGPVGDRPRRRRSPRSTSSHWWSEAIEVPVVAEGGVTPEVAATLAPCVDFVALGEEACGPPRRGPKAALRDVLARLATAT